MVVCQNHLLNNLNCVGRGSNSTLSSSHIKYVLPTDFDDVFWTQCSLFQCQKYVSLDDCRSAAKAAKHSTQVYSDPKPPGGGSSSSKRPTQPYVDYFEMTD